MGLLHTLITIYDGLYDYIEQDGYNNLGSWIETAAKAHNK